MKCTCIDNETDLQGVEDELKPLAIIYAHKTPLQYREACRSQRCMGKLLGYENHEVEEFIQSEIGLTCICVECGGVGL